jgi:hypothetical protein
VDPSIAISGSKASKPIVNKPDLPAPKVDLPAKYTDPVGGTTGTSCEAKCPDGAFIKSWKLHTSALVDSIQGLCSDGNWLKACGGDGGALSQVDSDSHAIPVRCAFGYGRMDGRSGLCARCG